MRILLALTVFAVGCGGPKAKPESSIVSEGSEQTPTCCCKTLPTTAEKEIVPAYNMKPRMECSAANGDCVDEVQCSNEGGTMPEAQPAGIGADGVPPPPDLAPSN